MADDSIRIRVGMTGSSETVHDANKVSRSIDDIGDKAKRASRSVGELNAASRTTRVSLGPFSTSARGGALAVGVLANAVQAGIPLILSAAEAVGTLAVGGGAAGAVGFTGLAQAAGVAKLGLGGLTQALGGNQTALKKLTPDVRALFDELHGAQTQLQSTAQAGLLPGLEAGTRSALHNLPVVNHLVGMTARTLGGLARQGGGMLGSAAWGRDISTVGRGNVKIVHDLGDAGLHLADAARHVLVEASPLAQWLAQIADKGAKSIDVWAGQARASGEMSRFFRRAREDITLLGQAGGHLGHGIINLFGANDVDGTRMLANLNRITKRFDDWTGGAAVKNNVGKAFLDGAETLGGKAVGRFATGLARGAPAAAHLFWNAFMAADPLGKLLIGGFIAHKTGLAGKAIDLWKGTRGASAANPLWVRMVGGGIGGGGPMVPGMPGETKPGKTGWRSKAGRGAGVAAENAGWLAVPFAPDITKAGMGTGNFNQYSGSKGWGELWRDMKDWAPGEDHEARAARLRNNAAAMARLHPDSNLHLPPRLVDHPLGTDIIIQRVDLDGERVGTLTASVRRRRQARN